MTQDFEATKDPNLIRISLLCNILSNEADYIKYEEDQVRAINGASDLLYMYLERQGFFPDWDGNGN
jgi:hypothetical protein